MGYVLALRIKPKGIPARTEMYAFPTEAGAMAFGRQALQMSSPALKMSFAVAKEKAPRKRRK